MSAPRDDEDYDLEYDESAIIEDMDAYIDNAVREVRERETAPPLPLFGHVFTPASVDETVVAIHDLVKSNLLSHGSLVAGSSFPRQTIEIFLRELTDGTLLWVFSDAPWLLKLSQRLSFPLFYLKVSEDSYSEGLMATRYFAVIESGRVSSHVCDPTPPVPFGTPWEEHTGTKLFKTLDDFLQRAEEHYKPRDRFWTFGRWSHFDDVDQSDAESDIEWCSKLTCNENAVTVCSVGDHEDSRKTATRLQRLISKRSD